jgi:hypothetical protein
MCIYYVHIKYLSKLVVSSEINIRTQTATFLHFEGGDGYHTDFWMEVAK